MKRQAVARDEDGRNSADRISRLPQPILHHILSLLSQNDAVRTSVLSKSWRDLGSTRPNFEFRERSFNGNKKEFLSVLNDTLQRYHDQNLSTEQFLLQMYIADFKSISLLKKWVPLVMKHNGVKTFHLSFLGASSCIALPSSIFLSSESLQELHLEVCKLNQINSTHTVQLNRLQTLSLDRVYISEETLNTILSSCPSIENISLFGCDGFKTIKTNKPSKLKHFAFNNAYKFCEIQDDLVNIEIDVGPTSLETIRIVGCRNWHHGRNMYFARLTSLYLNDVRLSAKSFDNFSSNFPCLEELTIKSCHGFEEFRLTSRSVKRLTIVDLNRSTKAAIDVANIHYFEYSGDYPPSSISLETTSSEWLSRVSVWSCVDYDGDFNNVLYWLFKLFWMLKALSQSRIILEFSDRLLMYRHIEEATYSGFHGPVVVEHLSIRTRDTSSTLPEMLNYLFRICRPRYISGQTKWETQNKVLTKLLCKFLTSEREKMDYLWKQDLVEVRMEASDSEGKQWHHAIEGADLPEQKMRIRLEWRDLLT